MGELLSAVLGTVISLLASLLPGFKTWYGDLEGFAKRWVMLGFLVAIAVVVFFLSCQGYADLGIELTCDLEGGWMLLKALFTAATANQVTYLLTPKRS